MRFPYSPKPRSGNRFSEIDVRICGVLMPVDFDCKRDLYLSNGEIVEIESEDVKAGTEQNRRTVIGGGSMPDV